MEFKVCVFQWNEMVWKRTGQGQTVSMLNLDISGKTKYLQIWRDNITSYFLTFSFIYFFCLKYLLFILFKHLLCQYFTHFPLKFNSRSIIIMVTIHVFFFLIMTSSSTRFNSKTDSITPTGSGLVLVVTHRNFLASVSVHESLYDLYLCGDAAEEVWAA